MSPLHFDYSNLRQVCLQAVVIVCFGVATGLMFNFPLLLQVFGGERPPARLVSTPVEAALPLTVELDEVLQRSPETLLVDARIPELYAAGHLPGAVSLPTAEVDAALPAFLARTPLDTPLIVYCSGYGCPDSFDLAERLLAKGYRDVAVFEGGFPQWHDAGQPVETGAP